MDQNDAFLEGEGNHWLKRNPVTMSSTSEEMDDTSLIVAVLKSDSDRIENILEVGSSSGKKLNSLCRHFGASGTGIDPSKAAVKQGTYQVGRNYSENLRFVRGVASQIPCQSDSFDLVVLGFFLYVEDRSKLLQSLCEADRVLKPGGYLVVRDFLTETPHRTPYAHHDGLFCYKNDYISFFFSAQSLQLGCNDTAEQKPEIGVRAESFLTGGAFNLCEERGALPAFSRWNTVGVRHVSEGDRRTFGRTSAWEKVYEMMEGRPWRKFTK